jgi:argininosuccinate lyase
MKVRPEVMRKAVAEDFSNATDLADYLVKKGMPFRQAHAVSGKAVHYCIEQGKWLADMSMNEFKELSELFEDDIYDAISPETCVKNRNSYGGTSYNQVEMQLNLAHGIMNMESAVVDDRTTKQVVVK